MDLIIEHDKRDNNVDINVVRDNKRSDVNLDVEHDDREHDVIINHNNKVNNYISLYVLKDYDRYRKTNDKIDKKY